MNAVKTRTSDQFNLEIKMETRTAPVGDVPVVQRSKCTDAEKCKGERVRERRRWEAGGGGRVGGPSERGTREGEKICEREWRCTIRLFGRLRGLVSKLPAAPLKSLNDPFV